MYLMSIINSRLIRHKKGYPMLKKIDIAPRFLLNIFSGQKIVKEYESKYNRIGENLDKNPELLDLFHEDLKGFKSESGRDTKYSSEQILRMIVIKFTENIDYRDLVIRVSQSDFLRNFSRIGMSDVMHYSYLCDAFNHVSPETWKRINEALLGIAIDSGEIHGEKLRIDSTVCATNIHYPTDASLLWDCYRVLSRLIRDCTRREPLLNLGNRFHTKKVKKLYTYISTHYSRKGKKTKQKVQTTMKTLLDRVRTIIKNGALYVEHSLDFLLEDVVVLSKLEELKVKLSLAHDVLDQAYRKEVKGEVVPSSERIFSIFEDHTELLKRGKAQKPVEFGHLVSLGQSEEKFITYYNVEETSRHDTIIGEKALQDHKEKFGEYPEKYAADKNYYISMDDCRKWEEKIPVYSVCKKGNRNQEELEREHSKEFKLMQKFRAGCEGSISVLKRVFGLKRCLLKGFKGFARAIGSIVFCHNLTLLAKS